MTYLLSKEVLHLGPVFNRMERREERAGHSIGEIVSVIASTDVCAEEYQQAALNRVRALKAVTRTVTSDR